MNCPSVPPQCTACWLYYPHCRYRDEFVSAAVHNELLAANLGKVVDDLHPVRVQQLFSAIPKAVSEQAST